LEGDGILSDGVDQWVGVAIMAIPELERVSIDALSYLIVYTYLANFHGFPGTWSPPRYTSSSSFVIPVPLFTTLRAPFKGGKMAP
jgi:hypothetical protein